MLSTFGLSEGETRLGPGSLVSVLPNSSLPLARTWVPVLF